MNRFWSRAAASLFLMAALLSIAFANHANASGSFVGRSGSHFTLNGQPWYVAGANNHYLGWGSQAEVDNVLNDAKAMHFNVIRTILHSVRGSLDGSIPTKWNWTSNGDTGQMGMHGVYILYWDPATNNMAYNDSTSDGLGRWDYVIWKAGQLGLKLDISLLDFWQYAGGAQQINADFKAGNYDMSNAPDRYTYFFQNARTQQFYKNWVSHVLNRVNTWTGVAYKNDPTIFAWDLMNEPEIGSTTLGQTWISQMAAYVKSIDHNHLLDSGNEGFTDAHAGTSVALDVTNQPNLDFASFHTYPDYHNLTPAEVTTLIDQNCATGLAGGKPVVMQEFGYSFAHSDQMNVYQGWVNELYNKDCGGWTVWRLTSKEDSGSYPPDNGEGFDIHMDNGVSSNILISAANRSNIRIQSQPTNTPIAPTATRTNTPIPTFQPPTNTPIPPTVTRTNTPIPTFQPPTNTPIAATKTNTPASTATKTQTPAPSSTSAFANLNIAPSARGYTWYNVTSSYSGNQRTEPGVNDGNLSQDFALSGGGDDNPASNEAAGVIWSTTQTVKSVKYYSGSCDSYQNGPFTGNVAIQFTTDGAKWTTDSSWTVSPAYPYDSCGKTPTADGQIFTFSGPARSGVLGVRIIGTVRTTDSAQSWHAIAKELQVFD